MMLSNKASLRASPSVLILEDDRDQMDWLIDLVNREINRLLKYDVVNDAQRNGVRKIKIIKTSNIMSLRKATEMQDRILLALLDCNTPDIEGGAANDQLVKTKFVITGQHRAVDTVSKRLPETPITLISSLGRFQRIVSKYYAANDDLKVAFIQKDDASRIKSNVRKHLKKYLESLND